MSLEVLFFDIRGRRCALPVADVVAVAAAVPFTPIPHAPPSVVGMVPIRGKVLPLIELGALFPSAHRPDDTHAAAPRPHGTPFLIVETAISPDDAPARVALAVDRVRWIGTVESPADPAQAGSTFLSATVFDSTGPAWLIDAAGALLMIRQQLRQELDP